MEYEDSPRGSAENENPSKNDNGVRGDPLRDLPEWLEEFTENLVDAPRRTQFFS